jgi:hypothetical protein
MDDTIKKYYDEYNYPKLEKLFKIMTSDGVKVKKKEIETFLKAQEDVQLLKVQQKVKPSSMGSIISFGENESWQVDIFFMIKYTNKNSDYGYIFCAIDVFTRKAYAVPMKNKKAESCIDAMETIINEAGEKPLSITTDSDSTMTNSKLFDDYLNKNEIALDEVILQDHHALGIVDRFARTLKTSIGTHFIRNKTLNWVDVLPKLIKQYNNTPHRSINNIKPSNVSASPENTETVLIINIWKSKKNNTVSDLVIGDKVRLKIKGMFKKNSEPSWSDQVYSVKEIHHHTITLNDDTVHKRQSLLKVPQDTLTPVITESRNVFQQATKENKQRHLLNREAQQQENIIEEPRIRKAKKHYGD